MTITFIKPGFFDVQSESDPERTYVVNLAGEGSCTCKGFQYREACKHLDAVRSQPEPTALAKAAAKAKSLTDEQLRQWQAQYGSGPVSCACLLEMAKRQNEVRRLTPDGHWEPTEWLWEGQPVWQSAASGVWAIWTAEGRWHSLSQTTLDAQPPTRREPKPVPAGVLQMLEGATEAERERALAIYR